MQRDFKNEQSEGEEKIEKAGRLAAAKVLLQSKPGRNKSSAGDTGVAKGAKGRGAVRVLNVPNSQTRAE